MQEGIVSPGVAAGRFDPGKSPGVLELLTGRVLTAYMPLNDDDPLYPGAVNAWHKQDQWDTATHFAYFQMAQQSWPTHGGQVDRTEMRALWVWSWRRFGATDAAIANRLGVELGSLKRKGVLARADALADQPHGPPRVRCPRVFAPEVERRPDLFDLWYDPRVAHEPSAQVRQLRAQFADLTRAGPPATRPGAPVVVRFIKTPR